MERYMGRVLQYRDLSGVCALMAMTRIAAPAQATTRIIR